MVRGWNQPGFDDSGWRTGAELLAPGRKETLKAALAPAMRVMENIRPKYVAEPFPGIYVVDALRNITGWARITVAGKPGEKIRMRFAEQLSTLWNNYSFSVRVKIVRGSAGVLFRCADENNFYCWQLVSGRQDPGVQECQGHDESDEGNSVPLSGRS